MIDLIRSIIHRLKMAFCAHRNTVILRTRSPNQLWIIRRCQDCGHDDVLTRPAAEVMVLTTGDFFKA